jgi:hypothetical protein
MEFCDRSLKRANCGEEFVFGAGEQAFFREKRFQPEPKRCKKCKGKRPNFAQSKRKTAAKGS